MGETSRHGYQTRHAECADGGDRATPAHSPYAVARRELCFCAGPEHHTFYACMKHRDLLLLPWPLDLFFSHHSRPLETVDPDECWSCYFCQEG